MLPTIEFDYPKLNYSLCCSVFDGVILWLLISLSSVTKFCMRRCSFCIVTSSRLLNGHGMQEETRRKTEVTQLLTSVPLQFVGFWLVPLLVDFGYLAEVEIS